MRQTRLDDFLQLEEHNKELEKEIKEELRKNKDKDRLLFQQNKMAALGEMLGNISHQWRQPLMEISSLFLPIEAKLHMNIPLDEKEVLESINKLNEITKYILSRTSFSSKGIFICSFASIGKKRELISIRG